MPRLPRVSSQQAIKSLKRLGFCESRQTGSHVVLKKA
ncbi:MAG: type II toxin-antitoxin system HicA family toxin [Cyanobacteria bacterium SBC]|nr:type II toxin-antitoxin system HicA family toxin [Cyanobacteria bacterium SBC]